MKKFTFFISLLLVILLIGTSNTFLVNAGGGPIAAGLHGKNPGTQTVPRNIDFPLLIVVLEGLTDSSIQKINVSLAGTGLSGIGSVELVDSKDTVIDQIFAPRNDFNEIAFLAGGSSMVLKAGERVVLSVVAEIDDDANPNEWVEAKLESIETIHGITGENYLIPMQYRGNPIYFGTEVHRGSEAETVALGYPERFSAKHYIGESPFSSSAVTSSTEAKVKTTVKCVFNNAQGIQECYAVQADVLACHGEGACTVEMIGKKGDGLTFKSSCGGYAQTIHNGENQYATFDCSGRAALFTELTKTITCVFHDSDKMQECASPYGACHGLKSCDVMVKAPQNETITFKSSCGGYANTRLTDSDTTADFKCGVNASASATTTTTTGAIVKSAIKCIFNGSAKKEECYPTNNTSARGCEGINSCLTSMSGVRGESMTWKSTCGGYAQTIHNGQDQDATFDCRQKAAVQSCMDSDGGVRPGIQGKVFLPGEGTLTNYQSHHLFTDTPEGRVWYDSCMVDIDESEGITWVKAENNQCTGSACYVIEYACTGRPNDNGEYIRCEGGCNNGACLQSSTQQASCASPYILYKGACVDPIPGCRNWPVHAVSCIDRIDDGQYLERFNFQCENGYVKDGKECLIINSTPSSSVPTASVTPLSTEPPAGYEEEVVIVSNQFNNPFTDTIKDSLEGQAAAELYYRAVIGGYQDGAFKGSRPVNRAEAAKFLLLTYYGKGADSIGNIGNDLNNDRFWDVVDGQWYTKYVMRAAYKGIISGYPDGSFQPGNTVKVGEFLKMISLMFGLEKGLPYSYTDVPADAWFAEYAGIAVKYKLFPSSDGSRLEPGKELSRKEIAIALYQFLSNR